MSTSAPTTVRKRGRRGGKIVVAIVLIAALSTTPFLYAYSQLSVSIASVGFEGIKLAKPDASKLLQLGAALVTGNYLGVALTLVDSVVLRFALQVRNPSFLPIVIPAARWTLSINDVNMGPGNVAEGTTVAAGSTGLLTALQEIRVREVPTLASAILARGGNLDLTLDGTLETRLLFLPLGLPFRRTESISLAQELEKAVRNLIAGVARPTAPPAPTATLEVLDSYWSVGGTRLASAQAGTVVTGHLVVRATGALDVTVILAVRQDRAGLPDRDVAGKTIQLSLRPGETRVLTIDFVPESGLSVRGYFLRLEWPGGAWQQVGYPPRLNLTTAPAVITTTATVTTTTATVTATTPTTTRGTLQIVEVLWTVGGQRVTEARVGQAVQAHVVVRATGGDVQDTITVRVRKDLVALPDITFVEKTFSIRLAEGQTDEVVITFTPNQASGISFRGFFVQVISSTGQAIWTMPDGYPPRLRIRA